MSQDSNNNWKEARDSNGRVYYYNSVTKQSSWEKPKELYSEEDKLLESSPWSKYYSKEARRYYFYNSETKQTTWIFPLQSNNNKGSDKVESNNDSTEENQNNTHKRNQSNINEDQNKAQMKESNVNVAADSNTVNNVKVYDIFERMSSEIDTDKLLGESKSKINYLELLEENNVDVSWSFQKVMENLIEDPRYWIISDPLLKQSYFEEFIIKKSKAELLKYNNSKHKLQQDFKQLIQTYSDNIKYYTRWSTFRKLISEEPIYTHSLLSSKEKKEIFMEFVNKLRLEHDESEKQIHRQAISEFEDYFETSLRHEMNYDSNWLDMLKMIKEDPRVAQNKNFEKLTELDMLQVYKKYYSETVKSLNEDIENIADKNNTTDRIARDTFKKLLTEMKDQGAIGITSEFADIYSYIKDEPAFKNLLGRQGSNALTLFWDLIENEKAKLIMLKDLIYNTLKTSDVNILLESLRFVVDFCKLKEDRFHDDIDFLIENENQIYDLLIKQALKNLKDEKKSIGSKLSALKSKLQNSIQLLLTQNYVKGNTAKEKLNFANNIKWDDFKNLIKSLPLLKELTNFSRDNYKILYDEEYEKNLDYENFKLLKDKDAIKSILFINTEKKDQKDIFDEAELKKLFFKSLIQVKEEYIQAEKVSHSNSDFMDY